MTFITQIEDRGAVVSWCPLSDNADLVAIGVKDSGGVSFDTSSHGGELEFYNVGTKPNTTSTAENENESTAKLVGTISTSSRFSTIAWSEYIGNNQEFSMGLVAGGMIDGTVCLWNTSAILSGEQNVLVATIDSTLNNASQTSSSAVVTAISFNPHDPSQLAIGLSNGEVTVFSLSSDPSAPCKVFPQANNDDQHSSVSAVQGGEITKLAWNTQVAHILASSCGNGTVTIYDIRQVKPWCEIRESSTGTAVSDVAWNPTQGLLIMTASNDDRNAVMKLWDLRASTSVPLATLSGHTEGILCMAWCPHDPSLLLSCGKDNKMYLWDLHTLQPIFEFPTQSNNDTQTTSTTSQTNIEHPSLASASLFSSGGTLSSSQQRRYFIAWSPIRRGILVSCSFDRKVQIHTVLSAAAKTGRTPQWMKRPNGISSGFGGVFVTFNSSHRYITLTTHVEQTQLVKASKNFEQDPSLLSKDYITYCNNKATAAASEGDADGAKIWGFMQIIFEANARQQLLLYLGFDPEEISEKASSLSTEDVTEGMKMLNVDEKSPTTPSLKNVDSIINEALIVGNFEAAVECCFQSGNFADGLVLSSCGGADLWAKTQARYFQICQPSKPFLSVVSAVINNQLEQLVANSDPAIWRETLAIISTYGKSEEFPKLCFALGDRVHEAGDSANASLCYMCALSLEKAASYWKQQLDQSGDSNVVALHTFMEKVTIFLQAMDPTAASSAINEEIQEVFFKYAKILADQGQLETAARFCRGQSQESKELLDRLYYCRSSQTCRQIIGAVPQFPFAKIAVNLARAKSSPSSTTNRTNAASLAYGSSDALPEGWIALQDPASSMTYYANQMTGETTWERPAPLQASVPTPQPPASPMYGISQQSTQPQQTQNYGYQQNASQQQYSQMSAQQPYSTMQQQQQQPYTDQKQQQQYPQQQSQYPSAQPTPTYPPQTNSSGAMTNGTSGAAPSGKTNRLATTYGDGFVTSASHPELAQRYGNLGTSNPYTGAARPGTAVVPNQANGTSTIPVPITPFNPDDPPQVPDEQQPISEALITIIKTLSSIQQLPPNEKRQLSESTKAVGVLLHKLSNKLIADHVIEQITAMSNALQSCEYGTANSIQTKLVNKEWRLEKDWLKGMKFLIQLASRRL